MAEPDFRALCAKLLQGLDENRHPEVHYQVRYPDDLLLAMARARAGLGKHAQQAAVEPPALVEGRERPVPSEQNMDDLAEVVLGHKLPKGDGARLIRRSLELWGHIPIAPIPISERLPGPEDCCGNPRNGQGEWCWGRENPRTPAGTPVIWRLMRRDCLEDEAAQWAPWWAIPIPTTQDSNND